MSISTNIEFKLWVSELKLRIRQSQLKAAIQVNEALLQLYWSLGFDIMERQMDAVWGSGFYENLSRELKSEFPDMKGFSVTNLKYCKQFVRFYSEVSAIRHQAGDELQIAN
jgi:predicted nuclease of restriction endonuclease-like (RecB) superfamily